MENMLENGPHQRRPLCVPILSMPKFFMEQNTLHRLFLVNLNARRGTSQRLALRINDELTRHQTACHDDPRAQAGSQQPARSEFLCELEHPGRSTLLRISRALVNGGQ